MINLKVKKRRDRYHENNLSSVIKQFKLSEESIKKCKECQSEYHHVKEIVVLLSRGDDVGPVDYLSVDEFSNVTITPGQVEAPTRLREPGLMFCLECECCQTISYHMMAFHKGQVFLDEVNYPNMDDDTYHLGCQNWPNCDSEGCGGQ